MFDLLGWVLDNPGIVLLIFTAFWFAMATFQSVRVSRTHKFAAEMIAENIETIYRKARTTLLRDDYGVVPEKSRRDWEKEKQHLFATVLPSWMQARNKGRPSMHYRRRKFDAMLDYKLRA